MKPRMKTMSDEAYLAWCEAWHAITGGRWGERRHRHAKDWNVGDTYVHAWACVCGRVTKVGRKYVHVRNYDGRIIACTPYEGIWYPNDS